MIFGNGKWIWQNKKKTANEYVEFYDSFEYCGGKVTLRLAAETDYTVELNGKLLTHGQFAGYKNEKYYDEEDITAYCTNGDNTLVFTVRYEGVNTFCHIEDGAGIIYSVECDGKQLTYSSTDTLCALSHRYIHGITREITEQIGYTSSMTATASPNKKENAVIVEDITYNFKKRPIKRIVDLAPVSGKPVAIEGRRIYDLGREDCGYVYIKVKCESTSTVKVAYGEHLVDGCVRYLIGARDFSLDFECPKGESHFVQYFVRVAGRYLEIFADTEVEILDAGIIPTVYPLTIRPTKLDGLDKQIYDISVRTLHLCMHTHYEDCPWREQSMYVVDSRNQMLCGYYAFEETEFQRESLIFMSKCQREDGMFEITAPSVDTPAIPFFSVMYPVAVLEYVEHTGDKSIIPEVMSAMRSILDCLYTWVDDTGLIANADKPYWNFYEWSFGNEGRKGFGQVGTHDLIISCAFVYAAEHLRKLCEISGEPLPTYDTEAMKAAIVKKFYDESKGNFYNTLGKDNKSVLGNAFAMLIGLGDSRTLATVKGDSEGEDITPATLSMLAYVYDVILAHDENGKQFVLDDIYKNYTYMLSNGATSFWETIKGEADFHNAGSLCHGWSAIPVYYFNKFFKEKFEI